MAILKASDFTFDTLMTRINEAYKPAALAKSLLFSEKGMTTTKVKLEQLDGVIKLIQSSPRGAPARPHQSPKRKQFEFEAIHLATSGAVLADSVQDVSELDGTRLTTVEKVRDRKLAEMQKNLEATSEWLRMGALNGLILDADGTTVILDLFAFFGISQQVANIDLTSTTINVPNAIVDAKRKSEAEIGDAQPTGWIAYASKEFLDALRANASIAQTLANWNAAVALRDDIRDDFGVGNVRFQELRDAAGLAWVEPDTALLVPVGVDGLLESHYAPADWNETVNTEGLPYYAKAERMPFDRGYEIEAQSNPIHICTKPRAIIKLVNTATP